MQTPDWEKIFAKHVSKRELVSRIDKEKLGRQPVIKRKIKCPCKFPTPCGTHAQYSPLF